MNVVFFYKSNWQNELVRLQRRNKFICALMVTMSELGIEGPRMRFPGQKESFPVYLQNLPHTATPGVGHNGNPDNPGGMSHHQSQDEPILPPPAAGETVNRPARGGSILRTGGRARGESMAALGRRVDFSLGMRDVSQADMGDVFEDRESQERQRAMIRVTSPSRSSQDRVRPSQDTARSTSVNHRFGRLQRVGTDSTQARERSNHRNRFFGRGARGADEEAGMADIPESGYNSSKERIDPRSGLITPQAMRMESDNTAVSSTGALPTTTEERTFHHPARAQTDIYEMRRMH